jgi:hypothetical protein
MFRRASLPFVFGILLVVVIYGACTPGSDITAAESDVVVTAYDNQFNFGSVKYYAMPDSMFQITSDPDESKTSDLPYQTQLQIMNLVEQNFTARGYERVDTNATPAPDFVVILAEQKVTNYNLYSYYPWYPWYGYWWYYPPTVGVSYAFTLGTLFIQMGEVEANPDPDQASTKTAYWYAAMNGILDDTQANLEARFTDSINQAFTQSPYLKTQ